MSLAWKVEPGDFADLYTADICGIAIMVTEVSTEASADWSYEVRKRGSIVASGSASDRSSAFAAAVAVGRATFLEDLRQLKIDMRKVGGWKC